MGKNDPNGEDGIGDPTVGRPVTSSGDEKTPALDRSLGENGIGGRGRRRGSRARGPGSGDQSKNAFVP